MEKILEQNLWVIQQRKEWGEILTNIETRNKYELLSERGERIGFIAEDGTGLFSAIKRGVLRKHRPLTATIFDGKQKPVFRIRRPWYWIWSSMRIETFDGKCLGHVHRKFRFVGRRYDLLGANGKLIGHVNAGVFRVWRFDLTDPHGSKIGEITKKWVGLLKEYFTDADRFIIRLEKISAGLESDAKAVFLGAAIALDLDYFDNNQAKKGVV